MLLQEYRQEVMMATKVRANVRDVRDVELMRFSDQTGVGSKRNGEIESGSQMYGLVNWVV